jgi:hypothetical protein
MTQFTNRADLLIAAGESIRMQENAGIKPQCKYSGEIVRIGGTEEQEGYYPFALGYGEYEFPLAVVEGRPVFVGDELYCKDGCKHKIIDVAEDGNLYAGGNDYFTIGFMSWNPPKPKTVIVELLRDDAYKFINCGIECPSYSAVFAALNKALES